MIKTSNNQVLKLQNTKKIHIHEYILLPLLVALAYGVKAYTDCKEKIFRRSQTINFLVCLPLGFFFKSFEII